jgi:hypothetical protein
MPTEGTGHLNISKDAAQKSNPEPPVLRHNASANSTTAASLRLTALHDAKRHHHSFIDSFPSHFPWSSCKFPY